MCVFLLIRNNIVPWRIPIMIMVHNNLIIVGDATIKKPLTENHEMYESYILQNEIFVLQKIQCKIVNTKLEKKTRKIIQ